MSASTSVTPALFSPPPHRRPWLAWDRSEIREFIRPCGLSPQKSTAIHRLSEILISEHGGQVPADLEALERLPGVGHKTASVVMAQAFGEPAFPVDTHIHRLAQRWGLSNGRSVTQTRTGPETAVSPGALERPAPADHLLWPRALHGPWLRRQGVRNLPPLLPGAQASEEDPQGLYGISELRQRAKGPTLAR
jgi:hypothetical protein